jgi:hypothetical protein
MASIFVSDIRQFLTPHDLAQHLATLPPPDWPGDRNPSGSTIHNTYRPQPSQWLGRPSMDGMVTTYKGKGWDRGPHLYLCIGAPNPKHDGIWQMTPPGVPGIHAGDCNPHRFGVEVVGDFEATTPTAAQQDLIVETLAVMHAWAHIGPDILAHRDCMTGRTCPGDHMYALMPILRGRLAARLAPPPPEPNAGAGLYQVLAPMWISETPGPHGPIALGGVAIVEAGELLRIDEVLPSGYGHIESGVGFVPMGGLRKK